MAPSANKPVVHDPKYISTLQWIAYISSSLLFFLWGFFFFDHLPMFLNGNSSPLPLINWIIQAVHLLLLIGYLLVFKYPRLACIVIPISSIFLFAFTAGNNALLYTLIAMIPVFILIFLWWRERKI